MTHFLSPLSYVAVCHSESEGASGVPSGEPDGVLVATVSVDEE